MTESQEPIRTFEQAHKVGAYGLARRWADSIGVSERTADEQLEQLAMMAALSRWMTDWQPIHIHGAALAGADRVRIAAAMGLTVPEMLTRWTEWAKRQRDLYDLYEGNGKTPLGVSADEYAEVAALLGITDSTQ